MDEQQTQATYSEPAPAETWDSEADGLAYSDYEADNPDRGSFDEDTPISEPEVTMNDDGDLEFSDEFFEGFGQEEPELPKLYTEDELKATPFEAWDINRLEGDVKDYVPIVRDQMLRRQMEAQLAQRPTTPNMNAPKPYTPSELADAAQKLACERLGLDDPDDFDEYESEHQAAMKLAMDELSQRRNMEVAQYQRAAQGYQDLQNFNAALLRQPDYMEFDRWFSGKLREAGVTVEQVNAGLQEYARRSGGDYNSLKGVIAGWYQEFRGERNRGGGNMSPSSRRSGRPPVLEGSGGSGYEGRGRVNMRGFGDLDPDAQAKALMRMGLV